jgi:nucleoside-diphosphate-sugar epimerase
MERAVILGVYDFIGYSLCRYLLDNGVEIEGVHIVGRHDHFFTEEKRMEIGRNANFTEISFREWKNSGADELVIISLYEHLNNNDKREQFNKALMEKLENMNRSDQQLILILPASIALKQDKSANHQLDLLRFIEKKNLSVLEIYVPTIYGPWQPEQYFFQQSLNNLEKGSGTPVIADWEWTHDALFIDDAVETIIEIAESCKTGKYFLKSGENNQWLNCAEELLGNQAGFLLNKSAGTPEIKDFIKIRNLKKNEKILLGLRKQKEQYSRIKESRG